ncbi:MAG TPA: glycosyltransferase family 39 protein [Candidatus Omnitrophota bacterium]|nr:glycosyltransferase family 39 protein [Candidatus Omnitrophota bacterium]
MPSAPYPSFPLFTPFILSWSAMLTGFWEDGGMHIIFSLAFFSFISVFYNILSFYSNRYGGILGIILLLSSNYLFILATISYRDVFMMAYNSLTIFFLLLWEEKENLSLLIVAALMSGMGLFTKLEGQAYFFIHLFILGIILQERKDRTWKETLSLATCFIMTSLSFFLPFGIFKILSKTPFNEKAIVFIDHQTLFRFLETIKDTIKELLFFTNWHPLFWWLFSLCLIIFIIRKKDKTTSLLLTTIAFYFLTTIFVFSATNAYFEKVFCNISRVSLHFYPLIVLFIILIMKKTFSSYNKNL